MPILWSDTSKDPSIAMLDSPTWDGTLTSSLQIPGETGSIQGRYGVYPGRGRRKCEANTSRRYWCEKHGLVMISYIDMYNLYQPVSTCYNLLHEYTEYTANCKPYSFKQTPQWKQVSGNVRICLMDLTLCPVLQKTDALCYALRTMMFCLCSLLICEGSVYSRCSSWWNRAASHPGATTSIASSDERALTSRTE